MKEELRSMLGAAPIEIIKYILTSHLQIKGIFFTEPSFPPSLQERFDLSSSDGQTVQQALDLRRQYDLPFWDGVMLSLFRARDVSERILKEATLHQKTSKLSFAIPFGERDVAEIRARLRQVQQTKMLAICSEVRLTDGSTKHIPMMDFHCPVGPQSLDLSAKVAKLLGVGGGFLVETDKSYHFYGTTLLTQTEMVEFLGRATLFSPIVDRAWIAHQLIELCCALRISDRQPEGKALRVVSLVDETDPVH
jgi:hypothetical protein